MPIAKFEMPDGRVARFEVPAGTTPEQAQGVFNDFMAGQAGGKAGAAPSQPEKPEPINYLEGYNAFDRAMIGAGKAANDFLGQFGLNPVDMGGNPAADAAIEGDTAGKVGNALAQAGMMYVGGQLLRGAGAVAGQVVKPAGKALEWLGKGMTNPTGYKQAAAGGATWGAVSADGDIVDRAQNALLGGVGAPVGLAVGRGAQKVGGKVWNGIKNLSDGVNVRGDLDARITGKLSAKGIDFMALPRAVQEQIRKGASESLDVLDSLNPEEIRRMADFEALGIKPTKGWVTRDPAAWWRENTLNTVNPDISSRFRDANQTLLQQVSKGAPDASDYQLGKRLSEVIEGHDKTLKANADGLYASARDMAGRDIPLDPHRFVNEASIELDQQMIGSKLPADTLSWFQKVTDGKEPFDMGTAVQRLQALNGRIYSTTDPAEAKALGIVKKHLVNAIDNYPGGAATVTGQDAQQAALSAAFREARKAAAERFRFQESNPLVERVLSGKYAPEDFPAMVGKMKVDDLQTLSKLQAEGNVPVMSSVRDAARAYIRDASTLQAETGGTFTVSGLRKALDNIGPEKGQMIFGPEEWAGYQRILRAGGAINNAPLKPAGSSTASNMLRVVDGLPIRLPDSIQFVVDLAGKGSQMAEVRGLLNPGMSMPKAAPKSSLLAPVSAGGLIGAGGSR